MIQQLIARFGGTPALILKLVFLGLVNAMMIWAIPTMISNESFVLLAVSVTATIALDFLMMTRRFIPAKYVVIGAIFLTAFQIIPIIYNISIAFTNYSTGNIGTQQEAIEAIVRDSVQESPNSTSYDLVPALDTTGNLVFILTPQIVEATAVDEGTDPITGDPATDEFGGDTVTADPATEEFGGDTATSDPATEEFGGDTVDASPDASALTSGTDDLNVAAVTPAGDLPPTYVGTSEGIDEVPPADVQRDEFDTVTSVTGFTPVPDSQLPSMDAEIADVAVPGPNGGVIKAQGYSTALELEPTLVYDPASDTFTSLDTGATYVNNGKGNYASPGDAEDYLLPGWRETVGFKNFASVFTDEQIRDPFFIVFVWTFVYAVLSVLLTFMVGLGLAIVLNKPRMRGQRIYRALLVLPYAVPAFLSLLVWAGLLNDDFGALNEVTGWDIPWLFDPFWAKVSVILVNVWLGFPYMFLVSTGALQAIPSELQEAARVDGARSFQVWRLVNMPLLLVALTPLLIASFAFNFNNFNGIFLLTGGGPAMDGSEVAGATDILISYTYKIAFAAGEGNDYGLASAISIYIFLIVGTISAVSFSRSKALREERA